MSDQVKLELSEEHAHWLETERKIPRELAAEMGIVSQGNNLVFEYRRNGELSWRQVRIEQTIDGQRTKTFRCHAPDGRTLKEAGIELSFWNEDELIASSMPEAPRIITEGQFDAASFRLAGATHVGSVPNGAVDRMGEGDIVPSQAHLDSWRKGDGAPESIDAGARFGTVDWWIESYTRTEAFTKLSKRSQKDYREALQKLADLPTKITEEETGRTVRVGELLSSSLSPGAVDLLYKALRKEGTVTRQANYAIDVARKAWRVVARQHPGQFMVPVETAQGRTMVALNPFQGLERVYGRRTTIPATREQAAALAQALADIGHPALGAAALIAFEWHQPENIISGHLTWTDYRPADRPAAVRIFHHKTGEHVWLPLEHRGQRFYPELEEWLSRLPRLGVPILLLNAQRGSVRPYSESYADHLVQKARRVAGLPSHVTLAACRHGGMTELGDAQITEQGIMALSGHRTPQAARVYVKRTERQRLVATAQRRRFLESEHDGNDCGNGAPDKWEQEPDKNG